MIKLEIKNADGSLYWKETFNTQEECDKWLAEEKTRKYWKSDFTWSSVETNPRDPVKEAAQQAKKELREQKKAD